MKKGKAKIEKALTIPEVCDSEPTPTLPTPRIPPTPQAQKPIVDIQTIVKDMPVGEELKFSIENDSQRQTGTILKLPSGLTMEATSFIKRKRKADFAEDILCLVDKENYSLKKAADSTGMSAPYAGRLYRKAGGTKKLKKGPRPKH